MANLVAKRIVSELGNRSVTQVELSWFVVYPNHIKIEAVANNERESDIHDKLACDRLVTGSRGQHTASSSG